MRTLPLSVLVLALLALPRLASAQDPPPMQCPAGQECPMRGAQCPAGQECPMHGDHGDMQARHTAMMQQHEQAAARIQQLQEGMHAASGEAKVRAMEALLDEMLAQHRAMHEMMMGMHGMKHEGMEAEHPDD